MKSWRLRHRLRSVAASSAVLFALTACGDGPRNAPPQYPKGASVEADSGAAPAIDPSKPGLAYLKSMGSGIERDWSGYIEELRLRLPAEHALNQSGLYCRLELTLTGEGTLVSVRVKQASEQPDFDRAAMEVVRDRAPFAAPPAKWSSDDGLTHVLWSFARDARRAGLAGAELRVMRDAPSVAVPRFLKENRVMVALERMTPDESPELADRIARRFVQTAFKKRSGQGLVSALQAVRDLRLPGFDAELRVLANAGARYSATALEALSRSSAPSVTFLESALSARRRPVALAAGRELARLGKSKRVTDFAARRFASQPRMALELAATAGQASVPSFVLSGLRSNKGTVRRFAALAIGRALAAGGVPRKAIVALTKALGDREAGVRQAACAALYELKGRKRAGFWAVSDRLRDADDSVRGACAAAAAQLEPARFAKEAYRFRGKMRSAFARELVRGLDPKYPEHKKLLERAAGHSDPSVRIATARAMAARGQDETLKLMLADPDQGVREVVIPRIEDATELLRLAGSERGVARDLARRGYLARAASSQGLAQWLSWMRQASSLQERVVLSHAWLARRGSR